jgi:outer membrane murein-binding lipoprotein Lpp
MAEEAQLPELKRLMEVVIQKVDGLASDVRTNTYSIDRLESKVDKLETDVGELKASVTELQSDMKTVKSDLRTLSGQFSDVGIMAIKDHQRVDSLDHRVDILEQKPH